MECIFEAPNYSYNGEGIYKDGDMYYVRMQYHHWMDEATKDYEITDLKDVERVLKEPEYFERLCGKVSDLARGVEYLANHFYEGFEFEVNREAPDRLSLSCIHPRIFSDGRGYQRITPDELSIALQGGEQAFRVLQKYLPVELDFEDLGGVWHERYTVGIYKQEKEDKENYFIIYGIRSDTIDSFEQKKRVEISKEDALYAVEHPYDSQELIDTYLA